MCTTCAQGGEGRPSGWSSITASHTRHAGVHAHMVKALHPGDGGGGAGPPIPTPTSTHPHPTHLEVPSPRSKKMPPRKGRKKVSDMASEKPQLCTGGVVRTGAVN